MSVLAEIKKELAKDIEFYGSMDNKDGAITAKYAEKILDLIKKLEHKDNQIIW